MSNQHVDIPELELTYEELSALSTERLLEIKEKLSTEVKIKSTQEKTLKILINSLYGALANKHFFIANPDAAAAVTSTGRFFVRYLAEKIESKLQSLLPSPNPYIIYGDTDSVYYTIAPFVEKKFPQAKATTEVIDWCDSFEKKVIQKIIHECTLEFADVLNTYNPDVIGVEREIIADSGVFVAKKKYYCRVLDSEGVRYDLHKPYIKVMGLELVKSTTPTWVKGKLKEAIEVILEQDEQGLKVWKDKIKREFKEQDIRDISMVSSISRLDYNLSDKNIPQGSKSGIIHNNFVKANGLEDSIELLKPSEKYKRCYIIEPNIFGGNIISYQDDKIVDIINREGIYDYDLNFEKYVENPLENMVASLNYDIKSRKIPLDLDW